MSCILDCSLLSSERHHDCYFRFKTNGNILGSPFNMQFMEDQHDEIGGEDSPTPHQILVFGGPKSVPSSSSLHFVSNFA